jgi:tetrahydromethanopterin S-methyltransferase subunit G
MDNSRDSSVWRSLAVAFGDGLAFGVGMKLSQNAPGKPGPTAEPEVAGRLSRLEHRVERIERAPAVIATSGNLDPPVLEALTHALEARLQESAALMDRRLAELDVKLALELKALHQQDQSRAAGSEARVQELQKHVDAQIGELLQRVNEDRNALQNQVISLHREFAAAVADIVEEQVATQVEERVGKLAEERLAGLVRGQLAPLEQQLREEIRQASAASEREVQGLRQASAATERDVEALRQRLAESDRNVLDVMLSAGEIFQYAARRLGTVTPAPTAPAPVVETPAAPAQPVAQPVEPVAEAPEVPPEAAPAAATSAQLEGANGILRDLDLPGFVQPRKAASGWSIPLVTSFLVTAGCIALLQYL